VSFLEYRKTKKEGSNGKTDRGKKIVPVNRWAKLSRASTAQPRLNFLSEKRNYE